MNKFSILQVSVMTFSGGVGKWVAVCFLFMNDTVENDFFGFQHGKVATSYR